MEKRVFLKNMALLSGFASLDSPVHKIDELLAYAQDKNPADLAVDEAYWAKYRKLYRLKSEYINLESGYYNITPEATLEKYFQHIRSVNAQGAYYMRTVQFDNKKRIAAREACRRLASEYSIERNARETLQILTRAASSAS